MTVLLIFTCVVTPYRIALVHSNSLEWIIVNYTIDFIFLVDIIATFFTAFYDEDFAIIEDRCVIAKAYATSWLAIDVLAIIPFDLISASMSDYNEIVRLSRLGRFYKIIKLFRLVRVIKLQKSKSRSVEGA